ncbi:MAG TPA: hypothetical protein VMU83_01930 [Hanamia sp.]|nr:hypothetical protein [Hanamia sp.]
MKKKFLFFLAFIVVLGVSVSGCYVDRGYYRPHYHPYHYHHHWHDY